jgi:AcrR family transcriptional regulator
MPPEAAAAQPARTPRSARAAEVVAAAWALLDAEGPEALTMRRLGDALQIKAPSLYKHLPDKAAVEAALVEEGLARVGDALHAAVAKPGRRAPVAALLATYRRFALEHPHHYRLTTAGPLDRSALPAGLEDWAGEPFFLVTGEQHRAQALWAFAHGLALLEIDGRPQNLGTLDRTWRAGAAAFRTTDPSA